MAAAVKDVVRELQERASKPRLGVPSQRLPVQGNIATAYGESNLVHAQFCGTIPRTSLTSNLPVTTTNAVDLPEATPIQADFYAWLYRQASILRRLRPDSLDWENLAEELEAMARKDHKSLRSHLQNLLSHLLKWHYQPSHRTNSWQKTIDDSRDEIEDLLDESDSLWNVLRQVFAESKAYTRAVRDAVRDTGPLSYPAQSPWTLEQVIDPHFPPDLHDPLNA